MWYVCDVLYVRVSCFVVRGCAVSMRYIDVCNIDVFSVVNMYHDHLKFVIGRTVVRLCTLGVSALGVSMVS